MHGHMNFKKFHLLFIKPLFTPKTKHILHLKWYTHRYV